MEPPLQVEGLNRLLESCGEKPRTPALWGQVVRRSAWHMAVVDPEGCWVGFLRVTSDQALNANLWDLLSIPGDPSRQEVIRALVGAALQRLRRELSGCSISISAPPESLAALGQAGFVIDPGGIRAMGLQLPAGEKPGEEGSGVDGSPPVPAGG